MWTAGVRTRGLAHRDSSARSRHAIVGSLIFHHRLSGKEIAGGLAAVPIGGHQTSSDHDGTAGDNRRGYPKTQGHRRR